MQNKYSLLAPVFLLLLGWGIRTTHALSTPERLLYEGRLLDSSGTAVATAVQFRFSLWSSADRVTTDTTTGGLINTSVTTYGGWFEEQTVTPSSNGIVSVQLGKSTALPTIDSTQHKYLQVEVKNVGDADTAYQLLDPTGDDGADTDDRKFIGSVPYAKNTERVGNRAVGTASGDILTFGSGGIIQALSGLNLASVLEFQESTTVSGHIIPIAHDTYDLGTSAVRWRDVYIAPGSLHIGAEGAEAIISYSSGALIFDTDGDGNSDISFASGSSTFSVSGPLSGASLTVTGNATFLSGVTLNTVTYLFPGADGSSSGFVLMTDSQGNLSWSLVGTGSLQARTRRIAVPISTATITPDGSFNTVNVFAVSETGSTSAIHHYSLVQSSLGQLQDIDLRFKVLLPDDFVAFSPGQNHLSFFYRNTGSDDTDSKFDILVEDDDGDDAFNALDGQKLFSTSWAEYLDEFDQGAFDPVAAEHIYITVKAFTSFDGTEQSALAGEIILTYTAQ